MESGKTVFAGYSLGERLGVGGSATVHVGSKGPAVGARCPGDVVAIKRFGKSIAGVPARVELLSAEVKRASCVRHPNVAAVRELAVSDDGVALVSEMVLGEALWMLLSSANAANDAVPLRVATAILCGVLDGLDAIHDAKNEAGLPVGLVHGDVGAHNVIVGNDGIARLTDLGTGKLVAAMHVEEKATSKLAYVAPEQILGQRTDRRADLYAASILFLEIVTGRRPFDNAPSLATQIVAGLRPEDLRAARVVPRDVLGVILRGLARRPQDRFPSASEMAKALVRAAPAAPPQEVAAWASRYADQTVWARASVSIPPAPLSSEMPVVLSSGPPSVNVAVGNRKVTTGNIRPKPRRSSRTATTITMAAVGLAFAIAGLVTTGPRHATPAAGHATSACDEPTTVSSFTACMRERLSRYFVAR